MSHILRSIQTLACFTMVGLGFCATARSAPLVTGTIPAVGEADPSGGSLAVFAGPLVSSFSGGGGPTLTAGTLTTTVYKNDASNPFGLNGLTFVYRIQNAATPTSASDITRITSTDFTGFSTDASYQTPASGVAPTSMSRSTPDSVGFSFSAAGAGVISPGQSSASLVVQTNATNVNSVLANLLGGASVTAASLGPVVPEPSMTILGASLVGLAIKRRRHRA